MGARIVAYRRTIEDVSIVVGYQVKTSLPSSLELKANDRDPDSSAWLMSDRFCEAMLALRLLRVLGWCLSTVLRC